MTNHTARLEALAAAELTAAGATTNAGLILDNAEDPRELADAAIGLCAALLLMMPVGARTVLLDGLRAAVLAEAND